MPSAPLCLAVVASARPVIFAITSICVPSPVVAGDLLVVSSGYEFGRPRPVFAVRPGASGDISLKKGETANEFKPVEQPARKGIIAEQQRQYGKLPVLLARMNPDLAMGDELLKKTGAGNLFMVFGEPDVDIARLRSFKQGVVDKLTSGVG